jgi:hypothetical protein
MEEISVPEEEILDTMKEALTTELTQLIEQINDEKQQQWLTPFTTVETETINTDNCRKPAACLSITKTKKKIEEAFIEKGEYNLEILTIFEEGRKLI